MAIMPNNWGVSSLQAELTFQKESGCNGDVVNKINLTFHNSITYLFMTPMDEQIRY